MTMTTIGLRRATGIAVASTAAVLLVACGDDGPTQVVEQPFNITFCSGDAPIWLAIQDDTGTWTQLVPTTGNTYEVKLPSGRGGIATVDTVGGYTELSLAYLTADEMAQLGSDVSWAPAGCAGKSVFGSVASVASGQYAEIGLGTSGAYVDESTGDAFELTDVPDGPQVLLAGRYDGSTSLADALILRRAINAAAGSTLPVLDFGGAEAFAPASAEVTVSGVMADEPAYLLTYYAGVDGRSAQGISGVTFAGGAPIPYQAIPAAQLQPDEFQQFSVMTEFRSAVLYFRAPSARTVALGPALNNPIVSTVATEPYLRPRVQLASQSEYSRLLLTFLYTPQSGGRVSLLVSNGYLGGTPQTWDVTVPDFSAASGWNNAWGLSGDGELEWSMVALGGIIITFGEKLTDGSMMRFAGAASMPTAALSHSAQQLHPLLRAPTERGRMAPFGRSR